LARSSALSSAPRRSAGLQHLQTAKDDKLALTSAEGNSMKMLATLLVAFVALSHVGILVLEMFLWDTPTGHRVFGLTPQSAKITEVLAMNQGLYNGFLAAGLIWGLVVKRFDVKVFFLACVVIAGVFGGLTAKPSIMLTQGLPALLALIAVWIARDR
jgi:putative membrane protein